MTTHKEEALKALAHIRKTLDGTEPIEGLARHQLKATADFAVEEVEAIQELKRVRRAADPNVPS